MNVFGIDIVIVMCTIFYVMLGLIWYIADTNIQVAVHETPDTTAWTRCASSMLFVISWPYWVYLQLRLTYSQYKAMNELVKRWKGS